jgi:hypothetical protein
MVNTKENVPRTKSTNTKKIEIYLLKINDYLKK